MMATMARLGGELRALPGGVHRTGAWLAALIVVVSLLAGIDGFVVAIPPFDFGDELEEGFRVAPLLGSSLFAATGLAAALCAHRRVSQRRWPWILIAVVFIAAAVDDIVAVHEGLETDKDSDAAERVLFVALTAFAAASWLAVAREMRRRSGALALWVGGAALWGAAILLDEIRWESFGLTVTRLTEGLEEVAELGGSALMVLGLLAVLLASAEVRRD